MKVSPLQFLRRQHQRSQWTAAIWVAAAGLAVECAFARPELATTYRLAVTAGAVLAALLIRFSRRTSLSDAARILDTRVAAANRFEALAAVEGRTDPLAAALRAEAQTYLAGRPLPRPYACYAGLAVLAVLCLHLLVSLCLPSAHRDEAPLIPAGPTAMASVPASPRPLPTATWRWISPERRFDAAPDELIPLIAELSSAQGLRNLALHVSINGQAQPPVPLPGTVGLGAARVTATLSLGQYHPRFYDDVTYYLAGETAPGVENHSPLQFIHIRRPRYDITLRSPSSETQDRPQDIAQTVQDLRTTQEDIAGQLFTLSRIQGASGRKADQAAVDRLAIAQAAALSRLHALSEEAPAGDLPVEARTVLKEIERDLNQAESSLKARDFAAALADQERALSRLAAIERMAQPAAAPGIPPAQSSALPEKIQAQLQDLALRQQTLADQIAHGQGGPAMTLQQDKLAQDLSQLAAEGGLSKELTAKIQQAADAARQAASQLNASDVNAAKEPSDRASMDLNIAQQGFAGDNDSTAGAVLARIQRMLIRASVRVRLQEPRGAADALVLTTAARRLAQIHAGQTSMREMATEQQLDQSQDGTATMSLIQQASQTSSDADALEDAAQLIGGSHIEADLKKIVATGADADPTAKSAASDKLLDLAKKIALRMAMDGSSRKIATEATSTLKEDQANASNAAASAAQAENNYVETVADAQQAEQALTQLKQPGTQDGSQSQSGPSGGPGTQQTSPSASGGQGDDGVGNGGAGRQPGTNNNPSGQSTSTGQADETGKGTGAGASRGNTPNGSNPMIFFAPRPRSPGGGDSKGGLTAAVPDLKHHGPKQMNVTIPDDNYDQKSIGHSQHSASDLAPQLRSVIARLERDQAVLPRQEMVQTAAPAEPPAAYEAAVADYFEALAKAPASEAVSR